MRCLLALSILLASCSSAGQFAATEKKDSSGQKKGYGSGSDQTDQPNSSQNAEPILNPSQISAPAENTVPPVPITGAYLHCRKLSVVDSQTELGCRFDDQDGNRLDPTLIGDSVVFDYKKPNLNVDISRLANPTLPVHDIVLQFNSESVEETAAAVDATIITAAVVDSKIPNHPVLTEKRVVDVLVANASATPGACTGLVKHSSCWYASAASQSCNARCSAVSLNFHSGLMESLFSDSTTSGAICRGIMENLGFTSPWGIFGGSGSSLSCGMSGDQFNIIENAASSGSYSKSGEILACPCQ